MAHPVTLVCSACIRWETRFTRRADMACPASLSSLSLPGLSWKLGLSSYNKSLIIRIMEGRNGSATDAVYETCPNHEFVVSGYEFVVSSYEFVVSGYEFVVS